MIKHENTGIFNPPAPQDVDLMRLQKSRAAGRQEPHDSAGSQDRSNFRPPRIIAIKNKRWLRSPAEAARLKRRERPMAHRELSADPHGRKRKHDQLATSFRQYRTVSRPRGRATAFAVRCRQVVSRRLLRFLHGRGAARFLDWFPGDPRIRDGGVVGVEAVSSAC